MEQETPVRKRLKRDIEREALTRIEDAARTLDDYKDVILRWRKRDANRWRRWRRWEIGRPNAPMLHWDRQDEDDERGHMKMELDRVIPAPFNAYAWWRQLLRGNFDDTIHDCPYELHELTSSRPVSDLLKTLNENQMEVLYYWAIRQYSPQRIAKLRGQSDRNILKVYATLIEALRKKLHERLSYRFDNDLPLTANQKQFMEDYRAGRLKTGKPKLEKGKKKRRP